MVDAQKIAGVVLLLAGIAGLLFGHFGYTREVERAELGPLKVSVEEPRRVKIPAWAAAGAILLGGVLLARRNNAQ